jgi:hypothetical protein
MHDATVRCWWWVASVNGQKPTLGRPHLVASMHQSREDRGAILACLAADCRRVDIRVGSAMPARYTRVARSARDVGNKT